MKTKFFIAALVGVIVVIAAAWAFSNGSSSAQNTWPVDNPPAPGEMDTNTQLPNPAAVYCREQGFTDQIVTAPDGSQSGNCVAPGGKVCDEWAFYRKECTLP